MRKLLERLGLIKPIDENGEKKSFGKFLKNAFTKNIGAKLLCFFGAVFLWFYVMDSESSIYEQTFKNIRIEYTENADGMTVLSSGDQTVDVTLSGKRSVIKSMNSSDITAVADISKLTEAGNYSVDIVVRTANETSVENSDPKYVNVYIDKSTTETVKVHAVFKGNTGYELQLSTYPENITVTGPASELSKISHARATVNLGNQVLEKDTTVYGVDLVLYDKNGNPLNSGFMQMSQATADVNIELYTTKELTVDAKYDDVEKIFESKYVNERILPDKLVVRGKKDVVEPLTFIETAKIDVDVEDLSSKDITYKTGFILPAGITLVQARNECEVVLSIDDFAQKEMLVPVSPQSFINLPDDKTASVDGGYVLVTVAGIASSVEQITPYDISVIIDAAVLSEGKNANCKVVTIISNDAISNVYIKEPTDEQKPTVRIAKKS